MPRYRCTNCEVEFSAETSHPRCPQCLRQHGLEEVLEAAKRSSRPRRGRPGRLLAVGLSAFVLVLLVGGGLYWTQHRRDPDQARIGILEPDRLRRALLARQIPEGELVMAYG